MKLTSVVDLIVAKFMPFSYFENDHIRHHYKLCALPKFINGLNNKQVKHVIVEIYNATKNAVMKDLASDIKKAPIPLASLNVDLWTSKISSDKYLGLWLFNMPARPLSSCDA